MHIMSMIHRHSGRMIMHIMPMIHRHSGRMIMHIMTLIHRHSGRMINHVMSPRHSGIDRLSGSTLRHCGRLILMINRHSGMILRHGGASHQRGMTLIPWRDLAPRHSGIHARKARLSMQDQEGNSHPHWSKASHS